MTLALFAAAVISGAPDGGGGRYAAPDLEVPGAFEQMEVPETLKALGVPLRLRAVRTREKPDALTRHFRLAFEKAGLFVPGEGELRNPGKLMHVTGLDVQSNTSYSVLLQPNLDGTTTVVVGSAYLHAAKHEAPQAFAPLFPGAKGLVVADLEVGQSLSYGVKAKPEEIGAFYRDTLLRDGYREVAAGRFERGRVDLRIWLKPREDGETGVVIIQNAVRSP